VTLTSGSKLGPYEILGPLGAGGMGEVYRARDPRLDRGVAIKVIPEEVSTDPDRLRRFQQEAKAAGALSHPNILDVHDVGTHEGCPYVVTELLEGQTLRERLGGSALSVRRAAEYGLQIARGLAAAHEKGIVHRDLKPENLFVTKANVVKILDFGLAKVTRPLKSAGGSEDTTSVAPLTDVGTVMGTVGYMSPEQIRGEDVDHRSDIFSFGVVLYELLAGGRPFRGTTPADVMAAILKEDPPQLSATIRTVPAALERIVSRCLDKNPEERFQSARDLAFDLEAVAMTGRPVAPTRRWLLTSGAVVALFALAVGLNVGGLRQLLPVPKAGRTLVEAIAVLPLENLSGDADQEYFADGMTEALIADLAKIRGLRVISRTSVMHYKGVRKPLREIADELGVDAVIEGSVLKSGNRVRITTKLIQVDPERHLWAERYERDLRDILALQGQVARAIAQEIRAALSPEEERRLANVRPLDPEAHEAYLRGRFLWQKRIPADMLRAIEYLQRAIDLDPEYALAYADLSVCYGSLGGIIGYVFPPREAWQKARTLAQRSIDIDPTMAEGHAVLGWVLSMFDWNWLRAEREHRKALELNPSLASARSSLALHLSKMGRHREALEETRRAQDLDPLGLETLIGPGYILYAARRYDEAISQLQDLLALHPRVPIAHRCLGFAYGAKQMHDEAIGELREAVALTGRSSIHDLALLGSAYAAAGKRNDALEILQELEELSSRRYVPAHARFLVHLYMGNKDEACSWLEKAHEERDWSLGYLKVEPGYDPFRSEACFQDVLRRMSFPE